MSSRRVQRAQDLVKEEISRLLLFKAKDPRFRFLSITKVEMPPDLRSAKVFFSLMDPKLDPESITESLKKASGFFRREVGRAVQLKFVPELKFEFDRSLEYAQHMSRILDQVAQTSGAGGDEE